MNRFLRDGKKEQEGSERVDKTDNSATDMSILEGERNDTTDMELGDAREIVDVPKIPIKDIDPGEISKAFSPEISPPDAAINEAEPNDKMQTTTTTETNEKCKNK